MTLQEHIEMYKKAYNEGFKDGFEQCLKLYGKPQTNAFIDWSNHKSTTGEQILDSGGLTINKT